jgi:dTDP-4-amino-4,6-dideoxygalactose transaminase
VIFYLSSPEITKRFIEALNAENIDSSAMYGGAIYKTWPQVMEMSTATPDGCPFTCPHYKGEVKYHHGMCPVTEDLAERLVYIPLSPTFGEQEISDVIKGIRKVAGHVISS